MILTLKRTFANGKATLGDLYADGGFMCHTLEDEVRTGPKVWGETAIPAGTYRVIVNESPRFKKLLPRLLNVPGFDGILIHKGNSHEDTHGCILVGDRIDGDMLAAGSSTPAFSRVFGAIQTALSLGEEVWITITNEFAP